MRWAVRLAAGAALAGAIAVGVIANDLRTRRRRWLLGRP